MREEDLQRPELTTYLKYQEMVDLLQGWAASYPRWISLTVIGSSAEGRDLLLATVSDHESGKHGGVDKRPAIWVDANHHAGEVIGGAVALGTIWSLIQRAEAGGGLLSDTTWYVQPRVAPDGVEVYLTTPHKLRSAPVDYPASGPQPGLHPADLDGDGVITQMRVPDSDGEWRVSELDRRLMVRRVDEDDPNAVYYRLYPESVLVGEAPQPLTVAPARWGLDFNRSYPHNWQPDYKQSGAGPYPLYPPETRANVDWIVNHPNICLIVSYHTFGGFSFRLPSSQPASAYRHNDLSGDYAILCQRFTDMTGGPTIQSYDEENQIARFGSLMDWAYNQHGLYGWVPELWDNWLAAGIDRRGDPDNFHGARDEEEQAALLAWNDAALGGSGFVDWHEFDHPDLGPVEIGGWTYKYTHQNPPGSFVPPIAAAHIRWTDHLASTLPRLEFTEVSSEDLGDDLWRVTAEVTNQSFLPTNISQQAIDVRRADPVRVELRLSSGEALDGDRRSVGHLAGRGAGSHRPWEDPRPSRNVARVSWIVKGTPSGTVVAWSNKTGTIESSLNAAEQTL